MPGLQKQLLQVLWKPNENQKLFLSSGNGIKQSAEEMSKLSEYYYHHHYR